MGWGDGTGLFSAVWVVVQTEPQTLAQNGIKASFIHVLPKTAQLACEGYASIYFRGHFNNGRWLPEL